MSNNDSFRRSFFWIYKKGFKIFSPIKVFNRFFNILNTVIPYFTDITFWLVQNIRSIHNIELSVTCVCLSLICIYPADDLREKKFIICLAKKNIIFRTLLGNSRFLTLLTLTRWEVNRGWKEVSKGRHAYKRNMFFIINTESTFFLSY